MTKFVMKGYFTVILQLTMSGGLSRNFSKSLWRAIVTKQKAIETKEIVPYLKKPNNIQNTEKETQKATPKSSNIPSIKELYELKKAKNER